MQTGVFWPQHLRVLIVVCERARFGRLASEAAARCLSFKLRRRKATVGFPYPSRGKNTAGNGADGLVRAGTQRRVSASDDCHKKGGPVSSLFALGISQATFPRRCIIAECLAENIPQKKKKKKTSVKPECSTGQGREDFFFSFYSC